MEKKRVFGTGGELLVHQLVAQGVDYVFTNTGSAEAGRGPTSAKGRGHAPLPATLQDNLGRNICSSSHEVACHICPLASGEDGDEPRRSGPAI